MTPILIFLGIPATYAVANVANNILGISVSAQQLIGTEKP